MHRNLFCPVGISSSIASLTLPLLKYYIVQVLEVYGNVIRMYVYVPVKRYRTIKSHTILYEIVWGYIWLLFGLHEVEGANKTKSGLNGIRYTGTY